MTEPHPSRDLATLQHAFSKLLTDAEGRASGARTLRAPSALEAEDLRSLVLDSDGKEGLERLDIYANLYFYRLRDGLAEDFPRLESSVGPTDFRNLVADFLLAHPPSQFSLREFGRPFARFVASHDISRTTPGIGDLAALEWARADSFHAADATPITRHQLLEAATGEPKTVHLSLVPAARVLRLGRAALALWSERNPHGAAEESSAAPPVPVCVWRRGFEVFHRPVDSTELGCLEALSGTGTTLDRIAEIISERVATDQAATRLARLLDVWTTDGLLCSPV